VGKDTLLVGLLMAAAILALVIAVGLWYWLSERWHLMVVIYPLVLLLGYVVFKIATMPPDQRSELLTDMARKLAILAGLALSTTAAIFFAERGDTLGVFAVQAVTAYAGWKAYESKQERLRVRKILSESRSQPKQAE
jgi:hypothetical protein